MYDRLCPVDLPYYFDLRFGRIGPGLDHPNCERRGELAVACSNCAFAAS